MHVFVHACVREPLCMLRPRAKNDIGALGDGIRLHEPLEKAWENSRRAWCVEW